MFRNGRFERSYEKKGGEIKLSIIICDAKSCDKHEENEIGR